MTKEEHLLKAGAPFLVTDQVVAYEAQEVFKVMDEYAKQEAISFKGWLDKRNRFLMDEVGQMPIAISKFETTEQLYNQFKNQQ